MPTSRRLTPRDRLSETSVRLTANNLVDDSTRVMLRLKALFRARAIRTSGTRVYGVKDRVEWLDKLSDRGARARAEILYAELDVLRALRRQAGICRVSDRTMVRVVRPLTLATSTKTGARREENDARKDKAADPEAHQGLVR